MQQVAGPVTWSSLAASLALHGAALGALLWVGGGDGAPASSRAAQGGGDAIISVRLIGPPNEAAALEQVVVHPDADAAPAETTPAAEHDRTVAATPPVATTPRPDPRPPRSPAAPAARVREVRVAEAAATPTGSAPSTRSSAGRGAGSGHAEASPGSADTPLAGAVDRPARPLSAIRPRYPESARRHGREADVVVDVRVSAAGRVEDALLVTAAGEPFDQAALSAVRRARFAPAERAGQRVASRVAMRLHFRLDR